MITKFFYRYHHNLFIYILYHYYKKKGSDRWRDIKVATTPPTIITDSFKRFMTKNRISYQELKEWKMNLIFTHCYARLDANVTKTQNHLLKSAYCIHPKTGRVCVPIDPNNAENFDPFSVPTVRSLCAEVD